MSSSIIERDPYKQKDFGQALIDFEEDMRNCCKSLRGYVEEVRGNIREDNAVQALNEVIELIEDIETELPGAGQFGTRQKQLAHEIILAKEYRFTKY